MKNTQEKTGCCQGVTYCPSHVPGLGWFKCGSRWKFSYMFTIMDESSHGTFFTRGRGFGWEGLAWPESITSFKSQPGRSFHIPHTIAPWIKPLFTFFWQVPDTHLITHWTTLIIFLIRSGRQLANCYDARQRLHKILLLISPLRFLIQRAKFFVSVLLCVLSILNRLMYYRRRVVIQSTPPL